VEHRAAKPKPPQTLAGGRSTVWLTGEEVDADSHRASIPAATRARTARDRARVGSGRLAPRCAPGWPSCGGLASGALFATVAGTAPRGHASHLSVQELGRSGGPLEPFRTCWGLVGPSRAPPGVLDARLERFEQVDDVARARRASAVSITPWRLSRRALPLGAVIVVYLVGSNPGQRIDEQLAMSSSLE